MEGPIPFKYSIDQAMVSLYFLRISNSFFDLSSVKSANVITSLDFLASRKAYFKCLGNSFKIKPSKLMFTSEAFST